VAYEEGGTFLLVIFWFSNRCVFCLTTIVCHFLPLFLCVCLYVHACVCVCGGGDRLSGLRKYGSGIRYLSDKIMDHSLRQNMCWYLRFLPKLGIIIVYGCYYYEVTMSNNTGWLAGVAVSNPAGGMCLLWFVQLEALLRRGDPLSRGVLRIVWVCHNVWSDAAVTLFSGVPVFLLFLV
jgi:hypothetical protein